METPTTSAIPMTAPKSALMIDRGARPLLAPRVLPSPERALHPSESAPPRAEVDGRSETLSQDTAVPAAVPATCSRCRITYLPAAAPALAVVPEDWVCDRCRAQIEAGAPKT
jgi:hypothetical protein